MIFIEMMRVEMMRVVGDGYGYQIAFMPNTNDKLHKKMYNFEFLTLF